MRWTAASDVFYSSASGRASTPELVTLAYDQLKVAILVLNTLQSVYRALYSSCRKMKRVGSSDEE